MPLNPAALDGQSFEALLLGLRAEKAALAITAISTKALFTITGRVLVRQIVGEVTTVIQSQANAAKLVYNPTAAGADTDLCATLDINADAEGLHYGITGTVADAMIEGVQMVKGQVAPLVLEAGSIGINTAASSTGAIKWTIWYVPLSDGAGIAAA